MWNKPSKPTVALGILLAMSSVASAAEPLTLSAEALKNLKVETNVGCDHFVDSEASLNRIVDAIVHDNSQCDAVYLYLAANTAARLNRPKDAMFLLYAAQIRKAFDYKRFGLGQSDGNNIQTYLAYLNEGAGNAINPLGSEDPKAFSEVVRAIEAWKVIPGDQAYYSRKTYGQPKLPKSQWETTAASLKTSFLNNFAYTQEKMLSDPQKLEAFRFVRSYNFSKIEHTAENQKRYKECLVLLGLKE